WGGTKDIGTLFKLTRKGSIYSNTVLHSFTGKGDGFLPEGTPLLESNGTIYGTAALGGENCHGIGCGTVFEIAPAKSGFSFRVLYAFPRPAKGAEPQQTHLVTDASGALYGTTRSGGKETNCADGGPGGAKGCGVVFKIVP
ncbi:MAG: choice-of-anchor tandem repeat GloVer-containing protein, partial [Candidatus Cybelea sp.]